LKSTLIVIGKTDEAYLKTGIDKFIARVKRYMPFEMLVIPDIKNAKSMSEAQQKNKEGEAILKHIGVGDQVFLLDENGKTYSSVKFANWLNGVFVSGARNMFFVIGGPYGFSPEVYARANGKIALSPMTFSHQMVRLIFIEQLYRANAILKGEPYHHV
jgi:23S rRNA (pseudouridine1915-N3)-methyltransferase